MGGVVSAMAFPVPPKIYGIQAIERLDDSKKRTIMTASGDRIGLIHISYTSVASSSDPVAVPSPTSTDAKGDLQQPGTHGKFTFLFSHGNAEDLGLCVPIAQDLAKATKCDVVAYEYCGYGTAEGVPSEQSCYESINAAFEYLTEVAKVPKREIIILGRSLGSGPSIDLAARTSGIGGLVVLSGLESGVRVVLGKGAFLFRYLDLFRNYKKIGKVDSLILVIHGEKDDVISLSHGKTLYKLSRRKVEPLWIPDVGHNDIPMREVNLRIRQFIKEIETKLNEGMEP